MATLGRFYLRKMSTEHLSTIDRLKKDNSSDRAGEKIALWRKAREGGQLFVVCACSDARLILPEMAYHVRTISATGPRSSWHNVFNYEKTQGIAIIDHFHCGGLGAKADIEKRTLPENEEESSEYVRDHVWATDPVVQSILTGSWTASRTHKAVLATVQDHHDGMLYIQGSFRNDSQTEHKTIPTYLLMNPYISEDIYKNGRPQLREHLVPGVFHPVLGMIETASQALAVKYDDFAERQIVQNPEFIVLSTVTKPLAVRFPGLFSEPGHAFQVTLSRPSAGIEVDTDAKESWQQVHYPIYHSVKLQDAHNGAFTKSRVLYIETGNMTDSDRLAKQAIKRRWIKEWLELPDREIVIAEVIAGQIRNIDQAA